MKFNSVLLALFLLAGFVKEAGAMTCSVSTNPPLVGASGTLPWYELGQTTFTGGVNCTDSIQGATFQYTMSIFVDNPVAGGNSGYESNLNVPGNSITFTPVKYPGNITLSYSVEEFAPSCTGVNHSCGGGNNLDLRFGVVYGAVLDVPATGAVGTTIPANTVHSWGEGALHYTWSLTNKPTCSLTSISNNNSPTNSFVPDCAGSYTLRAAITDQGLHSFFAEKTIVVGDDGSNPIPDPTPTPNSTDISISAPELFQSVKNFKLRGGDQEFEDGIDFDLVKGKGLVLFVTISSSTKLPEFAEKPIFVRAKFTPFSGAAPVEVEGKLESDEAGQQGIKLGDLDTPKSIKFVVEKDALSVLGKYGLDIKVSTDPSIPEIGPNNNRQPNLPGKYFIAKVHDLPSLDLVFVKVPDCESGNCYSPPNATNFATLTAGAPALIESAFPIPSLSQRVGPDYIGVNPDGHFYPGDNGFLLDAYNLCLSTWQKVGDPEVDSVRRVMGIVSGQGTNRYFDRFLDMQGSLGGTGLELCGGFATDTAWKSVAHEIGHNLGQRADEYGIEGTGENAHWVYTGDTDISGYNFQLGKRIVANQVSATCSTQLLPEKGKTEADPKIIQNIMGPGVEGTVECNWVSDSTYRSLWNGLIRQKNFGILDYVIMRYEELSKTIVPVKSNRIKANFETPDGSDQATFLVSGLQVAGGAKRLSAFGLGYKEDVRGPVAEPKSGIGVTKIPLHSDIYWVTVSSSSGLTVGGYSPDVFAMSSAIDSVPVSHFACPKESTLQGMHQSLIAAEAFIQKKKFLDALTEVQSNFRVQIESCLADVEVSDPLQFSKNKILQLVQEASARFDNFNILSQSVGPDNGLATLFLDKNSYSVGQRPFVQLLLKTPPDQKQFDVWPEVWNDGKMLPLLRKSERLWAGYSIPLSRNGDRVYADLFLIDRRLRRELLARENKLVKMIGAMQNELQKDLSGAERGRIQASIADYSRQLVVVKATMVNNRIKIGNRLDAKIVFDE